MTVYAADWVLPVDAAPVERGAVAVEGGLIAAVGTENELGPADRRFDAARRPTSCSSSRSATLGAARAIGLEGEIGTLTPGKSADLAVVSLAGSPYFPVEDPAAAVVFGGSPERVRFTLVQGDIRYEKGVTEWHELTVAASRARARMLEAVAEPVRELP